METKPKTTEQDYTLAQLKNEKLIEMMTDLSLKDVEFILNVWKDRISIWNPNTRDEHTVEDVWINGTFVELGIPKETHTEHNHLNTDD